MTADGVLLLLAGGGLFVLFGLAAGIAELLAGERRDGAAGRALTRAAFREEQRH